METNTIQFMVDFTLPQDLPEEFVSKIPQQRNAVNRLMQEGKLLNYSLSLENAKLWAVFSVESEVELREIIQRLPLTRFMRLKFHPLTFYNNATSFSATFSMN